MRSYWKFAPRHKRISTITPVFNNIGFQTRSTIRATVKFVVKCYTLALPFFRAWFAVLFLSLPFFVRYWPPSLRVCVCELLMVARVRRMFGFFVWYVHLNWMHMQFACAMRCDALYLCHEPILSKCAAMRCTSPICIFQWYWLLLLFSLVLPWFCDTFFFFSSLLHISPFSASKHCVLHASECVWVGLCWKSSTEWANELTEQCDVKQASKFYFDAPFNGYSHSLIIVRPK